MGDFPITKVHRQRMPTSTPMAMDLFGIMTDPGVAFHAIVTFSYT